MNSKKEKIFSWKNLFAFLLIAVVATQIIFPLSVNIVYANIFIYLLIVVFIAYVILHGDYNYKANFFIAFYGLFTFVCLASLMWTIDFNTSFPIVLRNILLLVSVFIMYNVIIEFDIKLYLIYGILIGAGVNFLIALNLFEYTTEFTNNKRFTGTLARSNDVAIVMIITMFSIIMLQYEKINKYVRFFTFIAIPLTMYTILLTVSKKGLLFGSFLGIIYFLPYLKNVKKMVFLLPIIVIILYFIFQNNAELLTDKIELVFERMTEFTNALEGKDHFGSTGERLMFIEEGKEFFSNNPILGTGINTFIVMDAMHLYSHNNYIEIVVGTGLVGLLSYYWIYIMIFIKLYVDKTNKNRNVLLSTSVIFLIMDTTLVSYSYKIIIITLLLISLYVDNDKRKLNV